MAYVTESITKFRGMNKSRSGVALPPEWALSCVNVIPDTQSGGLQKLRLPVALSESISGTGPNQFAMYENSLNGQKQIVAFFGNDVYVFELDGFSATLIDSNSDYNGSTPMSSAVANSLLFFTNGVTVPLKFNGTILQFWGIQLAPVPEVGTPTGTGITLATGRRYRVAYKNTVTGHVGPASDLSDSSGPVTNKSIPVTTAEPPEVDSQIDAVRIYSTLDGGADAFFNSEQTGGFPLAYFDNVPDDQLDQSERAPLINYRPPKAKYLQKWGARIFGFNITADIDGTPRPQGIFYTGYNRILVGRPEESVPLGNRLLLETGADAISGGGVITAGVIAFDATNKMFMFRGQPEDIVTNAPVEFTLYLQQLPWSIGCSGHFTIQSTPYGLVWRTPDLQVRLFNGTDEPAAISVGIEPIMKRINVNVSENERSAYWSYNEREWYLLGVALDGSSQMNHLLIFDLEPSETDNVGIFDLDLGEFFSLGVIEMESGEQKLIIGQNGILKELVVASKCENGVTSNPTATEEELGANWRSGYFGNKNPEQVKFMRFSRVSADTDGFQIKRYLVDDDVSTMALPDIIDVVPLESAKFETNQETRRMSIEIQFPRIDKDAAVQLLTNTYIPGAER